MKIKFIILLLIPLQLFSQKRLELFPNDLNVQPFTANILEPRLGFLFQLSQNELRLDIGNSIDIIRFQDEEESYSFGADLFTYTLLRSEKDFHFPVDAVDYLFGFNASYKKVNGENQYGLRLRVSHISAHFVDGHFDNYKHQWRDNLNPRVYSREFVELMPFYSFGSFRVYSGFTFIFHVDPEYIGKDNYQLGFDYFATGLFSQNITPFAAYDFKIIHINNYEVNHSLYLGIKFGKPFGKGFSTYFNFYSGKSIHGQYFDINKNYTAVGINLDL